MKPRHVHWLIAALLALSASYARAQAAPDSVQTHDSWAQHDASAQHHNPSAQRSQQASGLIKVAREVSRRFQDVSEAIAAGYQEQFGCVSHSDEGAMGVHFVNGPLVADGVLDPREPELLVYEPQSNGRLRLVAVDYLITSEAWHASNTAPPELMGQLFHLFESPNRFGLPEFYTLHVWAWKENPWGAFANWNPRVTCNYYSE